MDYKQIATRPNKTVYRDGDVCYKVFAADYNKADILNEALNQARVEQTGLFVPKVREVKRLDDGRLAIAMDYVAGKSLASLIAENPDNRGPSIFSSRCTSSPRPISTNSATSSRAR